MLHRRPLLAVLPLALLVGIAGCEVDPVSPHALSDGPRYNESLGTSSTVTSEIPLPEEGEGTDVLEATYLHNVASPPTTSDDERGGATMGSGH